MTASVWKPRQPPLRVPLIRRAHLLRSLGAILEAGGPQVALVSAPAGFGKTTLVTQFSEEIAPGGAAVAWADLELPGTSVNAMWRAVMPALARSSPAAAAALGTLATAEWRPDDRFFQRFQDALSRFPDPTVLVLDDVEALDDLDATSQLGLLVRRLPAAVRVVLSSRHDPSFSLHEIRLAGHLVELRAADLAFTPAETEQLLSGAGLGAEDVAAVTALTEGWPAGVQLARGVLKRPGDGARLAALFNAQSGLLADYLFNETFTRRSRRSQELLLRTSVVTILDDNLAAELTGRPDAGEAIAGMADLAPLLSRYDAATGARVAYRYHPLLRAYLVGELARRDRDLLHATHHRAAAWHERHDDYLNAISHARSSEDTDLLDAYLRRYAPGLILAGESDALLHILSESHLAPTAWESVIGACAAVRCRDTTTAARWLTHPHVANDPIDERLERLRASVALVLAAQTDTAEPLAAGDVERAASHGSDDLELLIAMNRSSALVATASDGRLERELKDALNLAVALGRSTAELQLRSLWAAAALGRGDFVETGLRVSAARARRDELGGDDPSRGFLHVIAAWVAYESLDDAVAQEYLDDWLTNPAHAMDPSIEVAARRYADLLGEALHPEPPGFTLAEPSTLADLSRTLPMSLRAMACFMLVRRTLSTGRPDRIRQALDHASAVLGDCGDVVTMQARVLVAQRRGELVRRVLQPVLDEQIGCLTGTSLTEALVMATTDALNAGHPFEAFSYLQRALTTVQEGGAYRPLVQAPDEVHRVMAEQADRLGAHREIVDKVVAYVRDSRADLPPVNPLTARELDILRELPTLNRVDEIAADLLVSTNTVKTHIRGIYRKFGVNSRKDAVAVARRLGIL